MLVILVVILFVAPILAETSLANGIGYWDQIDAPKENWWRVGASASGQYSFASTMGDGKLYVSKDYSKSWKATNFPILSYASIVCNNNCSIVYALVSSIHTGVLVSYDLGETYSNITKNGFLPSQNAAAIACSSTGQYVVAVGFYWDIYLSTDYGKHWSSTDSTSFRQYAWNDVFVSSDGKNMYAATYGNGIWYSTGHTNVWQAGNQNSLRDYFPSVTASADGVMVFTVYSLDKNAVYKSTSAGASYTKLPNGPNTTLALIRCNHDCSVIIAASTGLGNNQYIYQSTNYGVSWNLTIQSNYTCDSMFVTASGQLSVCASYYWLAGSYYTGLYSYQPSCEPGLVHGGFNTSGINACSISYLYLIYILYR